MPTINGTNGQDNLSGQTGVIETFNAWDVNNAPGDEGPSTDFDILFPGPGDTANGGNGGDWLYGGGANVTLNGGAGSDLISIDGLGVGDIVDGGSGIDKLSITRMTNSTLGLTLSIADSTIQQNLADGTSIVNIEQLTFSGGNGADVVTGGSLQDDIRGGGGNDIIVGGGGGDILEGGQGVDTISYASSIGGVSLNMGAVFGSASGGDATGDTFLDSFENVIGSNAQDHIIGSSASNQMIGNGGDDFLTGAGGDDDLNGGEGMDTAIYAGNAAGYASYYNAVNDTFVISNGTDGTDNVKNIESFQFNDVTKTRAEMIASSNAVQSVSISAATSVADEGNSGAKFFTFTVSLDGPSPTDQSVLYQIAGGGSNSASSEDFLGALSGTVHFESGQTTKTIIVEVACDIAVEADETFVVSLSNPSLGLTISTLFANGTIVNDDFFNTINGTQSNEQLEGTSVADHIYGFGGDDTILGFSGEDKLFGGEGRDWIIGGEGADEIDGGESSSSEYKFDVVDYVDEVLYQGGTQGVVVNLSSTAKGGLAAGTALDAFGTLDTISNINVVFATSFTDTIYFGSSDVIDNGVYGLAGNDYFVGGTGLDLAYYDRDEELGGIVGKGIIANLTSANVTVSGETVLANTIRDGFGDRDSVSGIEAVRGTANADYFYGSNVSEYFIGLNGGDTFDGGSGIDTVSYRKDVFYTGGTGAVTINLSSTTVMVGTVKLTAGHAIDGFGKIDTLTSIETVYGTNGNDAMYASASGNEFHSEGGSDKLIGGKGNDLLDGGLGVDTLKGGAGNDIYVVDDIRDSVVEKMNRGTDTVQTDLASYSLAPLTAVENLSYVGVSDFVGVGNSLANTITGGGANDHLRGNAGNDVLIGGAGDDLLTGGAGNDTFTFYALAAGQETGDDIILDFAGGAKVADRVSIDHNLGFNTVTDILAALTVEGIDKVLNFSDGSSITFAGKAGLLFAADDFVIV